MTSRRSFLTVALAATTTACGPLQQLALFASGSLELSGSTTVSFRFSGNHMFIPARIGRKSYSFIFDTGGAAILVPKAQAALNFPIIGRAHVVGVGDGGQDADLVRIPEARIGSAVYRKGTFIILPLPFVTTNPWSNLMFAGILGREFFTRLVTVIDFERSTLTFYEPSAFHPDSAADVIPLTMRDGHPNIPASIDGHIGSFDVDTGAAQALTLTRNFADSTGLLQSFQRTTPAVVGHGTGGISIGTQVRARTFDVGGSVLRNPVVGIPQDDVGVFASSDLAGNIGSGVLDRFTVTLDVPNSKLYLRPNTRFDGPFAANRAGVFTERDAGGAQRVVFVAPSSPGSEGGILPGDLIVSTGKARPSRLSDDQITKLWDGPSGTRLSVLLRRGNWSYSATLVLRDLF